MLFKVFHDVAMHYVFNEDTLAVTHAEEKMPQAVVLLNRLSVGCGTTPRRQSGYLLGICLFIRVIYTMLPPHGHCRNLYFINYCKFVFLFI